MSASTEGGGKHDQEAGVKERLVMRVNPLSVLASLAVLAAPASAQAGSLDWAVKATGPGADYVYDALVLGDGSVVVTGEFWNQLAFAASTLTVEGTDTLNRECDMFVARYSGQGTLLWARSGGGKYSDRGLRVTDKGNGNVEVVGTGFGSIAFNGGATTLTASEEYYFRAEYEIADGDFVTASLPATGQDHTPLMQPTVNLGFPRWMTELSDGTLLQTGRLVFSDTFTLYDDSTETLTSAGGSGDTLFAPEDVLLTCQDDEGEYLWVRRAGGPGKDWGNALAARPDGVGGVVVAGSFEQDAVFGSTTLTVSGTDPMSEVFLARYRLADETTVTLESQGSHDGYVRESTENSGVGGASFVNGADPFALGVGDEPADRQVVTILSFDTSSIPDGAVIVSARLDLVRSYSFGTAWSPWELYADIKTGSFNDAVALEAADFQAAATTNQVASLSQPLLDGDTSTGALSVLGRDAINKTGVTQFRLRLSQGDDDDLAYDGPAFYSGENADSSKRPKLVITYY